MGGVTANMNAILGEYLREFIGEGKDGGFKNMVISCLCQLKSNAFSPGSTAKFYLPLSLERLSRPKVDTNPGY